MASLSPSIWVTPRSVGNRDLPVERHRRQAGYRAEGLLEQGGPVVAITAQQRQPVGRDDRDQPVAVVLDLMQPVVAVGDLGAGRDDLKADIARKVGGDR